jgi:uncharacterized protein
MTMPEGSRVALRRQKRRRRRTVTLTSFALIVLVLVAVVVLMSASAHKNKTDPGPGAVTTAKSHKLSHHPTTDSTTNSDAGLPVLQTPTQADPLRVLEIGDSLGEDLGFQMQNDLGATGVADLAMDSQGDTGLANQGYYDWPTELQTDIESSHPEIVVIFLGANDGQGFLVNGAAADFGSPPWITAYTSRVDQMLQECHQAGARVVWVGMPPMQDATLNSEIQQIDAIFQQQVAKYSGSVFMSSAPVLAPGGEFTPDITTSSGETETIRTPDGVHLTAAGAELLSQAVISQIDSRWHLSLKP